MEGVEGRHGRVGGNCCFGVAMASFDGIRGRGLWEGGRYLGLG